jgi:hypothetical protein
MGGGGGSGGRTSSKDLTTAGSVSSSCSTRLFRWSASASTRRSTNARSGIRWCMLLLMLLLLLLLLLLLFHHTRIHSAATIAINSVITGRRLCSLGWIFLWTVDIKHEMILGIRWLRRFGRSSSLLWRFIETLSITYDTFTAGMSTLATNMAPAAWNAALSDFSGTGIFIGGWQSKFLHFSTGSSIG